MSNASSNTSLSPKFAGAIFFGIYGLLFFIFTKYTLLSMQDSNSLPLYPSLFISLACGIFCGKLFGPWLARKKEWWGLLLVGILLAVVAIIIGGACIFLYSYDAFKQFHSIRDYLLFYGMILVSITLIVGPWFIPLTGVAAVYFNKRFLPGLIAADQLRMQSEVKNHHHD